MSVSIYFLLCKLQRKKRKRKGGEKAGNEGGSREKTRKEDILRVRGWLNAGIEYIRITEVVK